jgi:hypothetical protein
MILLWGCGVCAALVASGLRGVLPPLNPILRGAAVLPAFGLLYLGAAAALGIPIPGLRRR